MSMGTSMSSGSCLELEGSVRPTWSSTPQPPAEALAACLPLPTFSTRTPVYDGTGRQDLPLSRTVIVVPARGRHPTYVDRFACDWLRLTGEIPEVPRRNHGPGRTPCTDASPPVAGPVGREPNDRHVV